MNYKRSLTLWKSGEYTDEAKQPITILLVNHLWSDSDGRKTKENQAPDISKQYMTAEVNI